MPSSETEATRPNARVFVSHSYQDKDIAARISTALKDADFNVWFDAWELQAGDSIATKLREGLRASDFLLVLLSPESVSSRWVREEMALALSSELRQRAITVVPVILRDCDIPDKLRDLTAIDLRNERPDSIKQLVEALTLAHDVDFASLSPRQFEELVAAVFEAEGYNVQLSMATRDGGRDLVIRRENEEFPVTMAVQVQHYKERRVTVETIRAAIGGAILAGRDASALIVSSTQLTSAAQELVAHVNETSGQKVSVIDGPSLEKIVVRHPQVVRRFFRRGDK
jgi:hypothetical protein